MLNSTMTGCCWRKRRKELTKSKGRCVNTRQNGYMVFFGSSLHQAERYGLGIHDGSSGCHGGSYGSSLCGRGALVARFHLRGSSNLIWGVCLLPPRDPWLTVTRHNSGRGGEVRTGNCNNNYLLCPIGGSKWSNVTQLNPWKRPFVVVVFSQGEWKKKKPNVLT